MDFSFAPGICTPSEVEAALDLGCAMMKFFPAESAGGLKYLKAISAPYKHLGVRFMPTGGVSLSNAPEYLSEKTVAAVGGTWLAKSADMSAGNWDAIRENVRQAAELLKTL